MQASNIPCVSIHQRFSRRRKAFKLLVHIHGTQMGVTFDHTRAEYRYTPFMDICWFLSFAKVVFSGSGTRSCLMYSKSQCHHSVLS